MFVIQQMMEFICFLANAEQTLLFVLSLKMVER